MGWQARLKDKPKFEKTCNKCGGTGVRRKFVSMGGVPKNTNQICKCQSRPEPKEKVEALPMK
jgi:hypothetical protein